MKGKNLSSFKDLYLKTARHYLNDLKEGLSSFENSKNIENIDLMHRASHSLKSENLIMGYKQTGNFCNFIEDIFYKIKMHKISISKELVELLKEAVFKIENSLIRINKENKEIDFPNATEKLQKIING